jgi:hypothetical protein
MRFSTIFASVASFAMAASATPILEERQTINLGASFAQLATDFTTLAGLVTTSGGVVTKAITDASNAVSADIVKLGAAVSQASLQCTLKGILP